MTAGSEQTQEEPLFLVVSGAPASGKSTLARSLAQLLGYSLLAKDTIKESLSDSLGTALQSHARTPEALSTLLSRAAMDVLWALAPGCRSVILEANFRPRSAYERGQILSLPGRKLEIYCRCPLEEAARRFAERAKAADHHAAHSMKSISLAMLREYDEPIGVCPVIVVDTGHPVDPAEIADRIRRQIDT